ncbi:CDP-diacylglycerol--glycerol-3-phosphate 3-phosphatidyltransferase/archaetidylinositol phosphate synthase [Methanococcoides alaskense]|uniref:CDP-diacylglycerol--glycerol-3-phosphate 3-phosphatidyltransferase/archaetidylinositol phosphate synthase n=2 Tax=Methanococcoides alaskense TaxID=325778 RepID=A0AA90ZC68_9EURY|nr:CDP-diacylglycerol--glycerol-3-phosphate 3-phosphatidyltransferase/archaetidylinositol phosphate synthase [Methanococcoides alaskense]
MNIQGTAMTIDSFRPAATRILDPIARSVANKGISPNALSVGSLVCAALAGISFYFSVDNPLSALIAILFVALNSFLDALDGAVARYLRTDSKKGDFLDHVIDRYSDVFIICGMFFGGHVHWQIGTIAIVCVLLTSYLGTQAQALGIGRFYGGIMGRADRLVLILIASLAYYIYSEAIFGYTIIGWSLVVIAIGSHITAIQRMASIWKRL